MADMSDHPSIERSLGVLEGKMDMVLAQQKGLMEMSLRRQDQLHAVLQTQQEHKTYFKILAGIVGVLASFFTYDNLTLIFKKLGVGS